MHIHRSDANLDRVTVTSPLGEKAAVARLSSLRHMSDTISVVMGALLLAAVVTQITDQLRVGRFEPTEYFAYFTIQTTLVAIVVLVSGGIHAWRSSRDSLLYSGIRASLVSYLVITGVVYNLLLRDIPNDDGYVGPEWANDAQHVWVPIYIVIDWMLTPGRARLKPRTLALAATFPLIWVAITLWRGYQTGWYPYPFLELDGPNGVTGVMLYVVGIAVAILTVTALAVAVNRWSTRGLRDVGEGRRNTGEIAVVRADLR